jgi:hypothetical protein
MSQAPKKGASLADAIDLDESSESDGEISEVRAIWPPSRSTQIYVPQRQVNAEGDYSLEGIRHLKY